MKNLPFPFFTTKLAGEDNHSFVLDDPVERRKYFELKAGLEIEKLREYLRENTFVGFLLGPKNSGKGTYSKLFAEAVGRERVSHISVGDVVRSVHKDFGDPARKKELISFLEQQYRGFVPLKDALDAFLGRSTKTLLPTELILAIVEKEISKLERKAIFVDGFPRNLDQVSYSIYFRTLMGYRGDPDFFVFIDVPERVIDERMKYRVVCPTCQTPRNMKLLRTKEIGYDAAARSFYLVCDVPGCQGRRMVSKEGDELGIEAIRDRIEIDKKVMHTLSKLEGVPKVFLRNAIPVTVAMEYADAYEITPSYRYEWNERVRAVRVIEEPWIVVDDEGIPSHSLLPPPIVVSLIKQVAAVLGL